MKFIFTLIFSIFSTVFLLSQESNQIKKMSLEFSLGYERMGFYNYGSYRGGFNDKSYEILSKNGNKIPIGIKTALKITDKNFVLLGLKINIHQNESNVFSGWAHKLIENKNNVFISQSIEIGHRNYFLTKSKFVFAIENNLLFDFSNKNNDYFLRKNSLYWKPSLRLEKMTLNSFKFFYTVTYGIGLVYMPPRGSYELIRNSIGIELGIMKRM